MHSFLENYTDERRELTAKIDRDFLYHPPPSDKPAVGENHREVNEVLRNLALHLCHLVPEGRERALMLTNLEVVRCWANAGIARNHDKFPSVEQPTT